MFFTVSRNMSGEYQFRVENSLGSYTAKCLLDVLCKYRHPVADFPEGAPSPEGRGGVNILFDQYFKKIK